MTRSRRAALLAASALLLGGCVFQDVREQQARLEASCVIEGTARAAGADRPIVVVLMRRAEGGQPWRIADHFVLERAGHWGFAAPAGEYRLAGFEDANRDLVYQPGEPFVGMGPPIPCTAGARVKDIEVAIPAKPVGRFDAEVDVAALQARDLEGQVGRTLGQLTAVGELASLSDARFAQDVAESGLWRPFDFIVASYAGVYFLERDDPRKTPVLFVHGVNGTPATFDYLIDSLDRTRFEPWVYYYPSGVYLAGAADHLAQTVAKLERRYPHERLIVVAHSMGGLVARGFIQRHAAAGSPTRIPLFITLSTPWDGHRAAEVGVKGAPAVVRVWEDMVPGSAYITGVFARPLPAQTAHHLVFTFRRKSGSLGASDDEAVTVASQLAPAAQAGAARIYGFDESHRGVLRNAEVSALLNRLLDGVR